MKVVVHLCFEITTADSNNTSGLIEPETSSTVRSRALSSISVNYLIISSLFSTSNAYMFMQGNSLFNPVTLSMIYFIKIITKTVKKYRKTAKYIVGFHCHAIEKKKSKPFHE